MTEQFIVEVASEQHLHFADIICAEMESSAKARGTGIAKRTPDYIKKKMMEGKAVIAYTPQGDWGGFCYIESWSHDKYVANSGLIVSPQFRKSGLARLIKERIFNLSKKMYPEAKIFGLTTGLAVMKINSELGYEPVTYSELTQDDEFWKGCQSCVNYSILMSKERKNCLCTAMLYDGKQKQQEAASLNSSKRFFGKSSKIIERLIQIKQVVFLGKNKEKKKKEQTEKIK